MRPVDDAQHPRNVARIAVDSSSFLAGAFTLARSSGAVSVSQVQE